MDDEGVDVDALEALLPTLDKAPRLLYTIPTFHNPRGSVLPDDRRTRLVRLARKHGFTILADDVYQFLPSDADARPPRPMTYHDAVTAREDGCAPGVAVSMGSFSKLLCPGLRIGWILSTPDIVKQCSTRGVIRSGGCRSHFTSGMVMRCIENGDFEVRE